VNVDHGQLIGRRLKDCPVVMDLDELALVGRRASSGRERRRLERFAQVCENLPNRARIADRMSSGLAWLADVADRERPGPTQLAALCLGST
jgi:hypothetical protein